MLESVPFPTRLRPPQVLELPDEDDEEDGASTDVDAQRKGKSAVIKTSTRQVSSATCWFVRQLET